VQALVAGGTIGDFRAPEILRFGFAPLCLRYVDVWDAVDILRRIMAERSWDQPQFKTRAQVT
jgi:kynureninase